MFPRIMTERYSLVSWSEEKGENPRSNGDFTDTESFIYLTTSIIRMTI